MSRPDQDIEKMKAKIKHEIEPFMNKILSLSDEDLLEFEEEYRSYLKQCFTSLNILNSFTIEQDVKALRTSIKEQVFLLYHYLGMVESIGNWTSNILIMLLVASGKDFHIESIQAPRIKHVYSLHDLEKAYVPLTIKLNFLRDYGIKTYPSIIDSKLRNDIAHFNFKMEKNKVTIRGKEVWEVVYPNLTRLKGATRVIIFLSVWTWEE
jgi:hypothetical protein